MDCYIFLRYSHGVAPVAAAAPVKVRDPPLVEITINWSIITSSLPPFTPYSFKCVAARRAVMTEDLTLWSNISSVFLKISLKAKKHVNRPITNASNHSFPRDVLNACHSVTISVFFTVRCRIPASPSARNIDNGIQLALFTQDSRNLFVHGFHGIARSQHNALWCIVVRLEIDRCDRLESWPRGEATD